MFWSKWKELCVQKNDYDIYFRKAGISSDDPVENDNSSDEDDADNHGETLHGDFLLLFNSDSENEDFDGF